MYRFKDRVRFSEMDEKGCMTIPAIMDIFQDCSDYQSEELGIGHDFLAARNHAWVLTFWQIVILRYPCGREYFTAETRPFKFDHFNGWRNFALYGEDGSAMVKANSLWTMIDVKRNRPVRPDPEEILPYGKDYPLTMDYAESRKIRLPETMEPGEMFSVRREHLDMNHHVNNVQYIRMALESLGVPEGPCELRAEYRRPAVLGDRILPMTGRSGEWRITALCSGDGKPYAAVEIRQLTE